MGSLILPGGTGLDSGRESCVDTYVVEMAFCSVAVMATRMFSFSMAASAARFSADLRSSPDMLTVSPVSVARNFKVDIKKILMSLLHTYQTCLG